MTNIEKRILKEAEQYARNRVNAMLYGVLPTLTKFESNIKDYTAGANFGIIFGVYVAEQILVDHAKLADSKRQHEVSATLWAVAAILLEMRKKSSPPEAG